MLTTPKTLLRDQSGATSVEYGLIASALALAIIPVMGDVNSGALHIFGIVASLFSQVM